MTINNLKPCGQFLHDLLMILSESFFDDLGPAGGVYLVSLVYLMCLSHSFALGDSQREPGDAKLPDQRRRRRVAGRKRDAARRREVRVAFRGRRPLPPAHEGPAESVFVPPVFQRGRRSVAVRTTFRRERAPCETLRQTQEAESRLTPWS